LLKEEEEREHDGLFVAVEEREHDGLFVAVVKIVFIIVVPTGGTCNAQIFYDLVSKKN